MKHAAPGVLERLHVSRAAWKAAKLPAHFRETARKADSDALCSPVAAVCASEILLHGRATLPERASSPDIRYLVLVDVPEPALVRLPRMLGVHRPDYRLYCTRDAGCIRRLIIGLSRKQPVLGIVDAYLLGPDLYVLTADFELRCFPLKKIPVLARLGASERGEFAVDQDGSYLHWPAHDLHVGVSQLLQEVDPAFMTDVAIERNEYDHVGMAVRAMREERALRQSDIPGISVRQVSRIEQGFSRLRFGAAQRLAAAFGIGTGELLDELGRRAADLRAGAEGSPRLRRIEADPEPAGTAA